MQQLASAFMHRLTHALAKGRTIRNVMGGGGGGRGWSISNLDDSGPKKGAEKFSGLTSLFP
jgi:hypothetical protein